jgi:multidrug resistance efflux pump
MATLFRAKWLLIPILLVLIGGGYAAWLYFAKWESTDDAQIDGHIHPVNARVGGTCDVRRCEREPVCGCL